MAKYRKKPIVVDAEQFTGESLRNTELVKLVDGAGVLSIEDYEDSHLEIPTLEGVMRANVGDWIIKGVKGEIYPCKPDIFEATYEAVNDQV